MESPLRLLLVEDNPGDAHLLEAMLEESGGGEVELDWVQSLDEGVRRLTKNEYTAVLLDLSLPDSHGIESVSTTHLFDTETPIIVLTGLDDDEAAFAALREGAQDYLVKGSFDGAALLRTIRFAKQRAAVQRELDGARKDSPDTASREAQVRALVVPPGGAMVGLIAAHLASTVRRHPVLYVCFDRPAAVLRARFEREGVPVRDLHFIDASGQAASDEGHIFAVEDPRDLDLLSVEVERACAAMGPELSVIIDSINSLILLHGVDVAAVFCHSLANRLRLLQIPADIIGHENQEWPFLSDRLSFLDGELHVGELEARTRGNDPGFA